MKTPMLIDKIQIGNIIFEAYIVEDENKLEAFAVFYQDEMEPLLLFQQNAKDNNVEIKLNTDLVIKIQEVKAKDSALRKKHFKTFQEFALNAEQRAKELLFKNKKVEYISDIRLIKALEKDFLLN